MKQSNSEVKLLTKMFINFLYLLAVRVLNEGYALTQYLLSWIVFQLLFGDLQGSC